MGSTMTCKATRVVTLIFSVITGFLIAVNTEPVLAEKPELAPVEFQPIKVLITLERVYLDGEKSEETFQETIWSLEDFWAKYDHWQLVDIEPQKAIFKQEVNDISPLLKSNGYFGVSEEGVLTIFNGKPNHSNIIQSFFQIDLGRLESVKREQLKEGIPIKNKFCYENVLETFKPYTIHEQK